MVAYKKKPKLAILTIRNSYRHGGVAASLDVVLKSRICTHYFEPTVFFLSFDSYIATSLKKWKYRSSYAIDSSGEIPEIAIGARWGFFEPGHYIFTKKIWDYLLKDYDYIFVVSGTALAGHPAALLKKKYCLWIATPYQDDKSERLRQKKICARLIEYAIMPIMKRIEKTILASASWVGCMSLYAKNALQKIEKELLHTSVVCPYPIITKNDISSINDKQNILIAVGRFHDPRKNVAMLLRSFELVFKQNPTVWLYIVGSKPAQSIIDEYATQASWSRIIFTGAVTNNELDILYKKAKISLISSYQEGLGIVGLEAMSYGMPIVATDCGGTRDFVIDDKTGYLVAINDDNAMAKAIITLLSDSDRYAMIAYNAQVFVATHFSQDLTEQLFQNGMIQAYPELREWFAVCDNYDKKSNNDMLYNLSI